MKVTSLLLVLVDIDCIEFIKKIPVSKGLDKNVKTLAEIFHSIASHVKKCLLVVVDES